MWVSKCHVYIIVSLVVAFLQMQVQEECGQGIGNMMLQVFRAFRRHVGFCFWMILGLVYPTGLNSPCHCCREGYICAHSEGRIWFVSRFYSQGVGIVNAKSCWVPFVLTSPQTASTHLPVWSPPKDNQAAAQMYMLAQLAEEWGHLPATRCSFRLKAVHRIPSYSPSHACNVIILIAKQLAHPYSHVW